MRTKFVSSYQLSTAYIYLFMLKCVKLQIQAEIEQFRVAGLQQEQDHHSLLRDIDEQIKETKSKAEDYENQASIISKTLDHVKTGLAMFYFTSVIFSHFLEMSYLVRIDRGIETVFV